MILSDPATFFDRLRVDVFDAFMSQPQVDGVNILLKEAPDSWPHSWVAYYLATPIWETNHTMQSVREAYWLSESWRRTHLRYYPYYGRSYDQLTWKDSYAFFGKMFGVDLVNNPDKALDPILGAKRLAYGMESGRYTGKKLADYLPKDGGVPTVGGERAFYWCREIINGLDRAAPIESIAEHVLLALDAQKAAV